VVCRYGGEEFALLLPETSVDSAFALADRLREAVAATTFPLPGGDCLSITMSAGVIAYAPGESLPDPDAFVDTADQALFRAKRCGRNRVEMEATAHGGGDLILDPGRAQMALCDTVALR